ncbi:uncharacterized protein MONOS_4822 [Monocercomonoides exilis]|uniref:uncharacterized protein n=1 Tax=Monocercomonoides exilis TaxID=2049356 RepID=UPI00355945F0|nr:hypothetical protein MONOS_4822 [Monocercomonoides exilis]|eukprot:MONOS_4822.1-p1 / transcript=MONOS_4822.1 / gene=MONOS_4822 / organism=Monocercomonoides_exilis_PA203 / gene_product=unspecified product / transcript_product=unspecified product / location=Mono_scaffold00134:25640-27584(-) / protein_length=184 / sequence_SO=supercontig / SO=protein_coding / is_pseudo=false
MNYCRAPSMNQRQLSIASYASASFSYSSSLSSLSSFSSQPNTSQSSSSPSSSSSSSSSPSPSSSSPSSSSSLTISLSQLATIRDSTRLFLHCLAYSLSRVSMAARKQVHSTLIPSRIFDAVTAVQLNRIANDIPPRKHILIFCSSCKCSDETARLFGEKIFVLILCLSPSNGHNDCVALMNRN